MIGALVIAISHSDLELRGFRKPVCFTKENPYLLLSACTVCDYYKSLSTVPAFVEPRMKMGNEMIYTNVKTSAAAKYTVPVPRSVFWRVMTLME